MAVSAGLVRAQAVQNVVLRNSFNPLGAGARGLGMGGAFIAVADDGTAASFNPVGLSQLRRSELALVGFGHDLDSTLQIPQFGGPPQSRTISSHHNGADFVGLAVPFDPGGKNLTVQLSYQRAVDLFGKGSATLQNTILAGDIISDNDLRTLNLTANRPVDVIAEVSPDQSGAFHTLTAATGFQATSRLSLGLSVNYWFADWDAVGTSSFRVQLVSRGGARPPELSRVEAQFSQEQSLHGLNLNTGFLLRYPKFSVGGVLRLPFAGDYVLVETDSQQTFVLGAPATPRQPFDVHMTSRLHWPRSAGIGVAFRPFRGFTLAADYSTSHWSRPFIEDVPEGALLTGRDADETGQSPAFTDRNFFDLLPASQTTTADTGQHRLGAEYLVSLPKLVIPIRAGTFRDRSPVVEFGSTEGRRISGYTVGTGLNFKRLVFDVAFEHRESEGRGGIRRRQGAAADASC